MKVTQRRKDETDFVSDRLATCRRPKGLLPSASPAAAGYRGGRHDPALSPAGREGLTSLNLPRRRDASSGCGDTSRWRTHAGEIAALIHDFLGRVLSMECWPRPRLLDPLLQKVGQRHESLVFAHPGKGRGVTSATEDIVHDAMPLSAVMAVSFWWPSGEMCADRQRKELHATSRGPQDSRCQAIHADHAKMIGTGTFRVISAGDADHRLFRGMEHASDKGLPHQAGDPVALPDQQHLSAGRHVGGRDRRIYAGLWPLAIGKPWAA